MIAPGRWWYLDLGSRYPEIEMYHGGWTSEQELGLIELGERVMDAETDWLFTTIYTELRDRIWSAVFYMYAHVIDYIRRERSEEWKVLHALEGDDRVVHRDEVPQFWRPDIDRWDAEMLGPSSGA